MIDDVYQQIIFPPMPDVKTLENGTRELFVRKAALIDYLHRLEETISNLRSGTQYFSGTVITPPPIPGPGTYVHSELFDANTILKADVDDTPEVLTIAENRIVGRKAAGEIDALTAAEVLDLIGLASDDDVTFGSITLNLAYQDYKLTEYYGRLAIQSQAPNQTCDLWMFTKDGDGTDNISFQIFGVGDIADLTNSECLRIGWNANLSCYYMYASRGGTGVARPLNIITIGTIDASAGEVLVEDNDSDVPIGKSDGYIGVANIDGTARVYFAVNGIMYYIDGAASAVPVTGNPIGAWLFWFPQTV